MASPQLENGYVKIANEIMEAMICRPELMRGALFPVIAVVWRKTYGWNKKEDAISISQFVEMTGYSKRSIIYAIQELEAKNVLHIKRNTSGLLKDTNIISFNKNYNEWLTDKSAPQVEKNRGSAKLRKKVVQNRVKKVQSFAHTKDTITKERTKETTPQSGEINKENMPFNKYSDDFELEPIQTDPDHKPKRAEKKMPDQVQQVFDLFSNPAKVTWRLREIERVAAQALYDTYGLETLKKRIDRIEAEKKVNANDPYFPLVNTPSTLLDKMDAVERYLKI